MYIAIIIHIIEELSRMKYLYIARVCQTALSIADGIWDIPII